jgi:hypothetical protein
VFRIENNGNQAARITNFTVSADDNNTGLAVVWPDQISNGYGLQNTLFIPGSVSENYEIIVRWDTETADVPTGVVRRFQIIMDYENAN